MAKLNSTMPAAAFLRRATRVLHQETEAAALGTNILEGTLTYSQYRDLIFKNYYLHQSLEPLLIKGLITFRLPAFIKFFHPRQDALQADLELLNLPLPPAMEIKPLHFRHKNEVLGGLYVFLGANLGGKVIYQALKNNESLQSLPDFHFYAACSRYPAGEWPQFCRLLDQHLPAEEDLREAKEGAEQVFRFFRTVYLRYSQFSP